MPHPVLITFLTSPTDPDIDPVALGDHYRDRLQGVADDVRLRSEVDQGQELRLWQLHQEVHQEARRELHKESGCPNALIDCF